MNNFPFPQADDLDKVLLAVSAINEGARTSAEVAQALDMENRGGAYYASAAGYLGFVEKNEHYYISEVGEQVLQNSDLFFNVVLGSLDHMTEDDYADLNITTAQRRAQCVTSWRAQLESRNLVLERVSNDLTRVISAAREIAARRPKERTVAVCSSCFTQLPATGICDWC